LVKEEVTMLINARTLGFMLSVFFLIALFVLLFMWVSNLS